MIKLMNGSFPLVINVKMSQTNWTNILYGLFQSTFHYGSSHWIDYEEYNFPGEKTGFDGQETGTLPSPRSVSVWKFTNNSTSWSSKGRLNLFTRWLLKARIGIISNNEWNCSSCDSRTGFGTGGAPDDSNTCGNEENWNPDYRERHIKVMGYIL